MSIGVGNQGVVIREFESHPLRSKLAHSKGLRGILYSFVHPGVLARSDRYGRRLRSALYSTNRTPGRLAW